MIKWGKEYRPYKAEIVKGGEYTVFHIPQYHKTQQGQHRDGFIQIVVKGTHNFAQGDTIKIKAEHTTGIDRQEYNGRVNVSLFCNEIEVKTTEDKLAEPNKDILSDDIPDDLF